MIILPLTPGQIIDIYGLPSIVNSSRNYFKTKRKLTSSLVELKEKHQPVLNFGVVYGCRRENRWDLCEGTRVWGVLHYVKRVSGSRGTNNGITTQLRPCLRFYNVLRPNLISVSQFKGGPEPTIAVLNLRILSSFH